MCIGPAGLVKVDPGVLRGLNGLLTRALVERVGYRCEAVTLKCRLQTDLDRFGAIPVRREVLAMQPFAVGESEPYCRSHLAFEPWFAASGCIEIDYSRCWRGPLLQEPEHLTNHRNRRCFVDSRGAVRVPDGAHANVVGSSEMVCNGRP
jgi:hypothetical protein